MGRKDHLSKMKRVSVIQHLLEEGICASPDTLAALIGVSKRTICRDIKTLEKLIKREIRFDKKAGGYRILPDSAEKVKIAEAEGEMNVSEFDKSFYSDDHDVPALYIGGQVVAIGSGYWSSWADENEKDEDHLRWKLEEGKTYRVTIEEVIG